MSTIAETAARGQARRRLRFDGWRWGGRIFLVFMLAPATPQDSRA